MTKLTTERLEELANATTPSVKYVGREIIAMARQLLAYEQAAKEVACWGVTGQRGQIYPLSPQTARMDSFPLYRAPVLPKQPNATLTDEGAKIIKAAEKLVRCKGRYHSEQNYRALAALFGVTVPDLPPLPSDEAPAQPVIPEEKSAIHGTKDPEDIAFNNVFVAGWNCCRSEVISLNETTAQPVSEPYKLPHDWIERQFAYQNLFNAIAAVVSKHPNIEISIKALDNSMLAAEQEHE
ncbi:hypothetical protein AT03_13465 [Hafnia alvei FB1]|uniref:Uncharacterized protein n=1 Tax=Hafnia alvei FB1 TaxID=1453496 RepID=A0A097R3K5_HAFAL|nr:hypothetical protein [Hafnia alvei]AIU73300.1 hypothetical protein AT03_13465 [Hafnia alvei FB1]